MPSTLREVCAEHVRRHLELDPLAAATLGSREHADRLTDYSPEAHEHRAELARETLRLLDTVPADSGDAVAAEVVRERLDNALALHEADLTLSALNVISSPVQDIRMVFTTMDTANADDWALIAARLRAVGDALTGLRRSLLLAAGRKRVAARRQVVRVAEQCDAWSGVGTGVSVFELLAVGAYRTPGSPVSEVDDAAMSATRSYAAFARFLREELLELAPLDDGVGRETYRLWARNFTGADIDLEEAYDWGWEEFLRIEAEVAELSGGLSPAEVARLLDTDPRYQVRTADELRTWLRDHVEATPAKLSGSHFDIPAELTRLECRVVEDEGRVAAYYTPPSADLSQPGQVWWTMPPDAGGFPVWRELSRLHHEGVPGHHLQEGTVVTLGEKLNPFQRTLCDISAYSEGWALYAERVMGELGFLHDKVFHLGMLDGQLYRAARVVVDIGLHLGLETPAGAGFPRKARWTPELVHEFLRSRTSVHPSHLTFELDRCLGWPGQAPSYKLGERAWLAARERARLRTGTAFSLKDFHRAALRLGPMGLTQLGEALDST